MALLGDTSLCRSLLGEPAVSLDRLVEWVARWVESGRPQPRQAHEVRAGRWPLLTDAILDACAGSVIPAHPLALDAERRLDERRQVALTRYYCDAGAGGVAVGVHTTQFAIREAGLLRPVLALAAETVRAPRSRDGTAARQGRRASAAPRAQAVAEAALARDLGYDAGPPEPGRLARGHRPTSFSPTAGRWPR